MRKTKGVVAGVGILSVALLSQTALPAVAAGSAAPIAPATRPAVPTPAVAHTEDGLYMSLGDFEEAISGDDPVKLVMIERQDIAAVQLVVPWGAMEKAKGDYRFERIDKALDWLSARGKKLQIQVQDRFFAVTPAEANVPQYIKKAGGLVVTSDDHPGSDDEPGAMAAQWVDSVRADFQNLLKAMATHFRGRLAGVNLPESSAQVKESEKPRTGYTAAKYYETARENMLVGKDAFAKAGGNTQFIQYMNFWPVDPHEDEDEDEKRMDDIMRLAAEKHIGVGGPDVLPDRPYPTQKAYRFIEKYKDRLPIVTMAVQEPTLKYPDPNDPEGRPYTRKRFTDFARDVLGARYLFWTTEADWLSEPSS